MSDAIALGATISRELYEFFVSWRQWVRDGAPDGEPYHRGSGLCSNTYGFSFYVPNFSWLDGLEQEIGEIYEKRYRYNSSFPFNAGEYLEYMREKAARTMHLNPERLAFVDRMIAEYEAAETKSKELNDE